MCRCHFCFCTQRAPRVWRRKRPSTLLEQRDGCAARWASARGIQLVGRVCFGHFVSAPNVRHARRGQKVFTPIACGNGFFLAARRSRRSSPSSFARLDRRERRYILAATLLQPCAPTIRHTCVGHRVGCVRRAWRRFCCALVGADVAQRPVSADVRFPSFSLCKAPGCCTRSAAGISFLHLTCASRVCRWFWRGCRATAGHSERTVSIQAAHN